MGAMEPMTDDRLNYLRTMAQYRGGLWRVVRELLSEVDRLRILADQRAEMISGMAAKAAELRRAFDAALPPF